jgi:prepilin-type N-terminal cleavage/methylation domain-containing protein
MKRKSVHPADYQSGAELEGAVMPFRRCSGAFTLVEILIVLVIMGIAATIVVPRLGDTDTSRLRAAAQLLIADLEYTQYESITHPGDTRLMVFDRLNPGYHIATSSRPGVPITDPIGSRTYLRRFGEGSASLLKDVTIAGLSLDGDRRLGFGRYGQLDQSTAAVITLGAGGHTVAITVDAFSGEIVVGEIN